jgi:hypothetical protein
MTAQHNPKDKTPLYQPDIADLHIQRAKVAKFNRAALALQKTRPGDSGRSLGTTNLPRAGRETLKAAAVSIAAGRFKD